MAEISQVIESLRDLWPNRTRVSSLGILALLVVIVAFAALKAVAILAPAHAPIFQAVDVIVPTFGLPLILLVALWAQWRRLPKASHQQILILFGVVDTPETRDLTNNLYSRLIQEVARRNLSDVISIVRVSDNHTPTAAAAADDILRASGARLIVYGAMDTGGIAGTKVAGLSSIHFRVQSRPLRRDEVPAVGKLVTDAINAREFLVREENSFIDKRTVAENLAETATFLTGLALAIDRRFADAIQVLDSINRSGVLNKTTKTRNADRRRFRSAVRVALGYSLLGRHGENYAAHLVDNVGDREHDRYAQVCDSALEKYRTLNLNAGPYWMAKAIVHFHNADVASATKAVRNAAKFYPPNDPAVLLSEAFLALWRREYDQALQAYQDSLEGVPPDLEVIFGVLRFLGGLLERNPGRTELEFGLGFVLEGFVNDEEAAVHYERFIGRSSQRKDEPMTGLIKYAREALSRIRSPSEASRR